MRETIMYGLHSFLSVNEEFQLRFVFILIFFQVNLQDLSISKMRWNFQDTDDWAILVNDETVINFIKRSGTPDELRSANINFCAKYLDMPVSWVNPYSISNAGERISSSFINARTINLIYASVVCFRI